MKYYRIQIINYKKKKKIILKEIRQIKTVLHQEAYYLKGKKNSLKKEQKKLWIKMMLKK